jgi:hypothetical protein
VILDWLTQDFADLFARDRRTRVTLWCDAKAEFRNLVPEASEHFSTRDLVLLAFDTSRHQGARWLKWTTEAGRWLEGKWCCGCRMPAKTCLEVRMMAPDCPLEYTWAGLTWLLAEVAGTLHVTHSGREKLGTSVPYSIIFTTAVVSLAKALPKYVDEGNTAYAD